MKSPLKHEVTAVDAVDLQVKKGEVFGLLGPNGAGKTTLIKMLTTLLLPTTGEARVNGYDVVAQEDLVKTSIGFVNGEERSFYWRLTGRQNLEFFSVLYGLDRSAYEPRIKELLNQLELSDAADNMYYSYSSGMKQKLALARGLICSPAVLFLDEPTKSVDTMTGQNLRVYIREKLIGDENKTVFLTTHRMDEAERLCDRLAIINKGSILFTGTVAELRNTTMIKKRFTLQVQGLSEEVLSRLHRDERFLDVEIQAQNNGANTFNIDFAVSNGYNPLPLLIEQIHTQGGSLHSCQKHDPRLEEIFTTFIKELEDVAV